MIRKTLDYLKDVRSELNQVSWATLPQLWGSTKVVLVTVALLSMMVGLFDLLCAELFSLIIR